MISDKIRASAGRYCDYPPASKTCPTTRRSYDGLTLGNKGSHIFLRWE
jgi:hypothetical protein